MLSFSKTSFHFRMQNFTLQGELLKGRWIPLFLIVECHQYTHTWSARWQRCSPGLSLEPKVKTKWWKGARTNAFPLPYKAAKEEKASNMDKSYHWKLPSSSSITHIKLESDLLNHAALCDCVSLYDLSSPYKTFLYTIDKEIEPDSYEDATRDPRWVRAKENEMKALETNGT